VTNADIIQKALTDLGSGWHTSRQVMWQARRNGWQMTTDKARGVSKVLARQGKARMLMDGKRDLFKII
jgi:hypothetical protein